MTAVPMTQLKRWLNRLADGLVLLHVCKNAAWSVMSHRYSVAGDEALTISWYLVAMGYLMLATTAEVGEGGRAAAGSLYRAAWAVGAALCGLAVIAPTPPDGLQPLIHANDWLALGLAFTWCALGPQRRAVAHNSPLHHKE